MDNTEGEDIVKVNSKVDCVFEIRDELMLIKKGFHGVCREKQSCTQISIRRNCGTGYRYIRCCLLANAC
jgi:hypothetical protein